MIDLRLIEEVRKYIKERLIPRSDFDSAVCGAAQMPEAMAEAGAAMPVPMASPMPAPMAAKPEAEYAGSRKGKNAFGKVFAKRKASAFADEQKPLLMSVEDARQELADRLAEKDESFSEYLLRSIDASGMTDVECYTKAQITRQLFNRIKNISEYRPSKATVIALGFALELPADEFSVMLKKAGFSLSNSSEFDLIVDYCVNHGMHDISDINELLFEFDQPLLGSK